ncbi:MAG: RNA replicase beta chain [Sanya fiers-like virus 11]|nr:MAG: RNA replicase beta chain [Sanya fiers-like virus 11]
MHKAELVRRLKGVGNDQSKVVLDEIFFELCSSLNTPRSLTAWLLYSNQEFDQLVSLEMSPLDYESSDSFAIDYFVSKVLSKYPHFKLSQSPESAALTSFLKFEEACKITNRRFRDLEDDPSKWDPLMRQIFLSARRKILKVLGSPDLDEIASRFGWGPGATSSASGSKTTIYDKFSQRLDVTSNALIMGHCCINSTPSWANCQIQTDEFPSCNVHLVRESFHVIRGNEIVFVPKNAKTHRTIAIEPHVNSYLQKGFGAIIRKRLLQRAGIDLNDQTYNQRLARVGSLTNELATIDLSGASDTISHEVVKYLLPKSWYRLLAACRSPQGYLKAEDRWIFYHKFSSMGNGYTFELESLIFWALCEGLREQTQITGPISVYGDDLIVPSQMYDQLSEVLTFAGFTFNLQKSFKDGPFRESCGKDYFLGRQVRPLFIKKRVDCVEELLKLANNLRRYAHNPLGGYCDKRFRSVYERVVSFIHPDFTRYKIPDGFGDGGLVADFDSATPSIVTHNGWTGYSYRYIHRSPFKKRMVDGHAVYTTALATAGSEEPLLGYVTPRKSTYPRIARNTVWEWRCLGPWS